MISSLSIDSILIYISAYLIGSVPYGLGLVRLFHKVDLRTIGSKNIGATNVLRAGYPILALLTLLLDAGKGAIAIYLGSIFMDSPLFIMCGVFAVLGHVFPIWLKFKGGKGVATILGSLFIVNIYVALLSCLTWLITALIGKYSSLSAIVMLIMAPIYTYIITKNLSISLMILIISLLSIYRHSGNIKRLLSGSETKIKFKK